jgi:hypothetical protein
LKVLLRRLQVEFFFRAMSGSIPGITGVEDVAAILAALSEGQSPTNSAVQSLPEYSILPATAVESMNGIARFTHDEYQGEGLMRLSFNATMRSWQEMGKKSIFLLPAIPLAVGETLSMSYLDNTMLQLWQLRGQPTSSTTFAMFVGLAGKLNPPLDTPAVGTPISVGTPTYFLLAVEELEEVGM